MNIDALENRQIEGGDFFYKNKNEFELQVYSIILSIFVCYYLRITDMKTRKEFAKKMDEILNDCDRAFKSFMEIPLKEEKFILKNIKLEKGIASNRALLDNIFSLFIAINNKVPIFIVGKPGCSKSLSVHLIQKAMKGKSSNNQFF
jgi:ABC-type transport system involved in cytochrome bd biosynthesis fused ATPase/permease subunit